MIDDLPSMAESRLNILTDALMHMISIVQYSDNILKNNL